MFREGHLWDLSNSRSQITLEVGIHAKSEQGISRDTLNLKVRETLKQIGANILKEREK